MQLYSASWGLNLGLVLKPRAFFIFMRQEIRFQVLSSSPTFKHCLKDPRCFKGSECAGSSGVGEEVRVGREPIAQST